MSTLKYAAICRVPAFHRAARLAASIAVAVASLGTAFASNPASGRFDGPPVVLGHGTARTYVILEQGRPVEIGVALSEAALDGLPEAKFNPAHQGHHGMQEYLLELPQQASPTPFRLVEVDWNPSGHIPPGIYDLPHFDFHFYTIDLAARNRIVRESPTFIAEAERVPETPFIPAGYVSPSLDLVEPKMGRHWVNPASPELHGQTFTHTFIYGSWDGQLIFGEPMLTRAFLATKPNVVVPVPMAERYSPAGYYPSEYGIQFDEASREYRVSLKSLVERSSGADRAAAQADGYSAQASAAISNHPGTSRSDSGARLGERAAFASSQPSELPVEAGGDPQLHAKTAASAGATQGQLHAEIIAEANHVPTSGAPDDQVSGWTEAAYTDTMTVTSETLPPGTPVTLSFRAALAAWRNASERYAGQARCTLTVAGASATADWKTDPNRPLEEAPSPELVVHTFVGDRLPISAQLVAEAQAFLSNGGVGRDGKLSLGAYCDTPLEGASGEVRLIAASGAEYASSSLASVGPRGAQALRAKL